MKCPRCGSRDSARILYGMPVFCEELEEKLNNKKIFLGGCCIPPDKPKYHCNSCNKDFAKPPMLLSKKGSEDYRMIVTSIKFSESCFFNGFSEIRMKQTKKGIFRDGCIADSKQREMTPEEWLKVLDTLYSKLFIHEWKKCFVDPDVVDGTQWELEIHLTGGRKRVYYGRNAYPPLWKELKSVFRPYFKEAGINF